MAHSLSNNIDPQEDELDIPDDLEVTLIEIDIPPAEDLEEDLEEDENSFEDENLDSEDSDDTDSDSEEEEKPVKKVRKAKVPKEPRIAKEPEVIMRKIPLIGKNYRARNFTMKVVSKNNSEYICEIIACHPNSGMKVGEQMEVAELAFASDFYQLERMGERTL